MKCGPAIHNYKTTVVVDGKWSEEIERRVVRVMAIAEGYAMVRQKGCIPYVAPLKELEET